MANLLERLPSSSRFAEAQLDDPEFAAAVLAMPERPDRGPRVSEYSPVVARLDDVYDRLGDVASAVIAAAGGKPRELRPAPRPRTQIDVLRARADRARHELLVAEVEAAQERWARAKGEVIHGPGD